MSLLASTKEGAAKARAEGASDTFNVVRLIVEQFQSLYRCTASSRSQSQDSVQRVLTGINGINTLLESLSCESISQIKKALEEKSEIGSDWRRSGIFASGSESATSRSVAQLEQIINGIVASVGAPEAGPSSAAAMP